LIYVKRIYPVGYYGYKLKIAARGFTMQIFIGRKQNLIYEDIPEKSAMEEH